MKYFIIVSVALIGYVTAEEQYSTDDFDLDEVLSNERLLKGYSRCLLDKGPCTPEVKRFKDKIPEVLETKCAKCTDRQKEMGKQLANEMKKRYPDMWKELVGKYDSDGKFQQSFQEFLSNP